MAAVEAEEAEEAEEEEDEEEEAAVEEEEEEEEGESNTNVGRGVTTGLFFSLFLFTLSLNSGFLTPRCRQYHSTCSAVPAKGCASTNVDN